MIEVEEGRSYEFSEAENRQLAGLSGHLTRLGKAILTAGVLLVAYIVLSFLDPEALIAVSDAKYFSLAAVDCALWIAISLLVIYLSIKVMRLARPLRLIVGTKGADIGHLMDFVGDLHRISHRLFFLLVLICILLAVSLVLVVLVF
jgi:hypothetical protein